MSACRLGLGTAQWGMMYGRLNRTGVPHITTVSKILEIASDNFITTIDTAYAYGSAEEILGKTLRPESKFDVVTKIPDISSTLISSNIVDSVLSVVQQSLTRLKTKHIYGLLLHRADNLLGKNGQLLWDLMLELKSAGIVTKVGVSVYTPTELELIIKSYDVELVQCPYSYVDQRFEKSGAIREMHGRGIEIHTRSVFLQGLLLSRLDELPSGFDALRCKLVEADQLFLELGLTRLEASLGHSILHPMISKVIVGCETLAQCQEFVLTSKKAFPADMRDRMTLLGMDDLNILMPGLWPSPV